MFICITEIDADTGKLCTDEPMRTGPVHPYVKGFVYEWESESIYPIDCDETGRYMETPLYYGICDDDANTNVIGVIEVLTEEVYMQRKRAEMYARKRFDSWVWDELTLSWNPPIQYPTDGNRYYWDEANTNWVALTKA
jgi:hypothetical protein